MKLRFYAKGDLLVSVPGQTILRRNADTGAAGSPVKYVGRVHVPAKLRKGPGDSVIVDEPASNPARSEAYECDSDTERGRRLMKLTRRDGSLWPADEATAAACGVPFVATEFSDGEHVAKSSLKPASAPQKTGKGKPDDRSASV